MEIKVRIAEEKDVERVAMLYERLHDYLETHDNHPRWKRGIYPTKVNGVQTQWGRPERKARAIPRTIVIHLRRWRAFYPCPTAIHGSGSAYFDKMRK